MKILSNEELQFLVKDKHPRLRMLAKARADKDPKGEFTTKDLDRAIQFCMYAGDKDSTSWLKSLKVHAENGDLDRMRNEPDAYESHKLHISSLVKNGAIKFDLYDSVILKDNGKRGKVVDFNPESKQYVVLFNPFEVKIYDQNVLEKVGTKEQD